jgi:hypothetical protein
MEKTRVISQTRVRGEVEYNDGEFAEIQTVGIEASETDLLLKTIQVHREDTSYSCENIDDADVPRIDNACHLTIAVIIQLVS